MSTGPDACRTSWSKVSSSNFLRLLIRKENGRVPSRIPSLASVPAFLRDSARRGCCSGYRCGANRDNRVEEVTTTSPVLASDAPSPVRELGDRLLEAAPGLITW